jgi:hypothetical protein
MELTTNNIKWSEINKKDLNALYNKLLKENNDLIKDKTINNFINTINKEKLKEYILNSTLGLSRKETYFFLISKYMKYNNIESPYIEEYKQIAYDIKQKREKTDGDNELTNNEIKGYIEYNELCNILEKNKNKFDTDDINKHYQYLLLLMLLDNPFRTSFYTSSIIIHDINEIPTDDKTNNYVILEYTPFYLIQKDKVSNLKYFKDKNFIPMSNKVKEHIEKSFKKFRRSYLFESLENIKVCDNYITSLLRKITNNKYITINMVRSSYVTYKYNDPNITYNDKQKIADRLRHSPNTASLRYYKIVENNNNKSSEEDNIKKQLEECKLKLEEFETNSKIITTPFKKLQNDYLYKLNKGKIRKVNNIYMEKYNIKFDDKTNKYYIEQQDNQ